MDYRDDSLGREECAQLLIGEPARSQRLQHRWGDEHDTHSTRTQPCIQLPGEADTQPHIPLAVPHVDVEISERAEEFLRGTVTVCPSVTEERVSRPVNVAVDCVSDSIE